MISLANGTWELRLGDCLDPATGLASLADKSVDHVITDPPYEAEAHTLQRRTLPGAKSNTTGVVAVDPLDFDPITEEVRAAAAEQIARVARRWSLVFCQAEAVAAWRASMVAGGAVYKRACIWVKTDGMPQLTGDRPGMGYESIVAAHAPGRSEWNAGGRLGVWTFSKKSDNDANRTGHPTQKPESIMEALIRDFTDQGDLICDPFAGSGTTGVAAIRLGRRFIGWERDPKYHAIAVKRLAATREQLGLFGAA